MFKVNLLYFCFFKRQYSTFLQVFPWLLGMPTFLVAWKPILSLLVQLWQKNNAYVTFPVRLLTHTFPALLFTHSTYTGTAIPKSIRAQQPVRKYKHTWCNIKELCNTALQCLFSWTTGFLKMGRDEEWTPSNVQHWGHSQIQVCISKPETEISC